MLLLVSICVKGQNTDSLYIREQLGKATRLAYGQPDLAKQLLDQALAFANQRRYAWGQMVVHLTEGILAFQLQNLEESYQHLQLALPKAQQLNDQKALASIYNSLGNYYFVKENFDRALKNYLQSLDIENQINQADIAVSYLNIGMVYKAAGNYPKAIEAYQAALTMPAQFRDQVSLHAHINLANLHQEQREYELLLYHADSALSWARELASKEGIGRAQYFRAIALMERGALSYAKNAIDSALSYLPPKSDTYLYAIHQKANLLQRSEQYDKARALLDDLLPLLDTVSEWLPIKVQVLQTQARLAQAQSRPDESLQYWEAYSTAKDSLQARRQRQELNRLLVQFETERKEKEIQRLAQQTRIQDLELNQYYYLTAGLLLLLLLTIIAGWLFYRQKQLLAQQETLQAQLRWRRAQLNPHFFFNILSSIHHLLTQSNSPPSATKALHRLAKLMRQTLENSNHERISLAEEIEFLTDYMNLAQLQTPFAYQLQQIPEDLDTEDWLIPPMLLQPFVENAIQHGLQPAPEEQRKLSLICQEINPHQLQIIVRDNGVGRKNATTTTEHISRATQITEDRQKLMKGRFTFQIIDLQNADGQPAGTEIRFQLYG